MPPLRLAFMGTPDFAAASLAALIAAGHDVAAVYSQPPRPAGRGQQPRPSPVQRLAESHGLPVLTPTTLKTAETQQQFAGLGQAIALLGYRGSDKAHSRIGQQLTNGSRRSRSRYRPDHRTGPGAHSSDH